MIDDKHYDNDRRRVDAALEDICNTNVLLWTGLFLLLEDAKVLKKAPLIKWLQKVSVELPKNQPEHVLGDSRLDVRLVNAMINVMEDPSSKPGWTPVVYEGGKKDD